MPNHNDTKMITLREKLSKLPPERRRRIEEEAQKLIEAENAAGTNSQRCILKIDDAGLS